MTNKLIEETCADLKCEKPATRKAKTVFGDMFYCTFHGNRKKNNICVGNIEKI